MKLNERQLKSLIKKLVNEVGQRNSPRSISIGDVLYDPKGNKITVTNIWINLSVASGVPTTWVEYSYETIDGRSGDEKNTVEQLVKMLTEVN